MANLISSSFQGLFVWTKTYFIILTQYVEIPEVFIKLMNTKIYMAYYFCSVWLKNSAIRITKQQLDCIFPNYSKLL